jgi:hypothetical protein
MLHARQHRQTRIGRITAHQSIPRSRFLTGGVVCSVDPPLVKERRPIGFE